MADVEYPKDQEPYTGNVCCIGAGYVGGPTMAMMAYKTGLKFTVVDLNQQVCSPLVLWL